MGCRKLTYYKQETERNEFRMYSVKKSLTLKNSAENAGSYLKARYYAPWTCRFISVDQLAGIYAQLTPYNYASNSPIGQLDIDGLQNPAQDSSATSSPKEKVVNNPKQSSDGISGIIHFIDSSTGKTLGIHDFGGEGESIRSINKSHFLGLSENNFEEIPAVKGFKDSEISVLKNSTEVIIEKEKIINDINNISTDKIVDGERVEQGLYIIFDKSRNVITSEINLSPGTNNNIRFPKGKFTTHSVFMDVNNNVFSNKIILAVMHTHPTIHKKEESVFGTGKRFNFSNVKGEFINGPGASDTDFDTAESMTSPVYAIGLFERDNGVYFAAPNKDNLSERVNRLTTLEDILNKGFNLINHIMKNNF